MTTTSPAGAAAQASETPRRTRAMREHLCRLLMEELRRVAASGEADATGLGDALIRDALRERATDIHLEPHSGGTRVRLRIDGALLDAALLTREQAVRAINFFKTMAELDPVRLFKPEEARRTYELDDAAAIDLRLAFAPCLNGTMMSIRLLNPETVDQNINSLGMSEVHHSTIRNWIENNRQGMFLVTGPTGSGKTTTSYALMHELKVLDQCIMTLEDPVEVEVDGLAQIQVNAQHGLTFSEGIKSMLRLDPDLLMVGEIRGRDSARAAAEAAVSGRALISTLHSRDAVGAVTSLRNWGLSDHDISAVLTMIVAQRLVRRLCPKCRKQDAPQTADRRWLEAMGAEVPKQVWRAVGCDECAQLGYKGRTGVFEIWEISEQDYNLILNHADERTLRHALAQRGHQFLMADGIAKAMQGLTSVEELRESIAVDPRSPQSVQAAEMAQQHPHSHPHPGSSGYAHQDHSHDEETQHAGKGS
jgi:type II secretory ATPase GspE/PulE/Tfp pilus assembly ATPase PilB-like protein